MSTEENKALARRCIKAINEKDLATIDEIMVPEEASQWKKESLAWLYGTFGDHCMEVTDMIAEGDKVWVWLATSGGHTGEWLGVPPTGKNWKNSGFYLMRIVNGKISLYSLLFDNLNLLQQLGATIEPPKS